MILIREISSKDGADSVNCIARESVDSFLLDCFNKKNSTYRVTIELKNQRLFLTQEISVDQARLIIDCLVTYFLEDNKSLCIVIDDGKVTALYRNHT